MCFTTGLDILKKKNFSQPCWVSNHIYSVCQPLILSLYRLMSTPSHPVYFKLSEHCPTVYTEVVQVISSSQIFSFFYTFMSSVLAKCSDSRIFLALVILILFGEKYSRTPLIRTLKIRIANFPNRFGPSGKFIENSTQLTCFKITCNRIKYIECYGFQNFKSGVVERLRCWYIL